VTVASPELKPSLTHPSEKTDDFAAGEQAAIEFRGDSGTADRSAGEPRGRFRVLRPHARGGLGQVYVARDNELGRQVALKEILTDKAANPELRARFVLEVEIRLGGQALRSLQQNDARTCPRRSRLRLGVPDCVNTTHN
jgi:hypothetical protein